jgi:cyclopropane fatty-acyl-phospholipid synthase-like methyltransferase
MEILYSPAADRNKQAIYDVLKKYILGKAHVLEIASGTGQHAEYLCAKLNDLTWQPTDIETERLKSIDLRSEQSNMKNILKAQHLNVLDKWPEATYDFIFCSNMVHISPFTTTPALFKGAGKVLVKNGLFFLYGPFFEKDVSSVSSNIAFDRDLQSRDSQWGIRSKESMEEHAKKYNFTLISRYEMPANNLLLVFKKMDSE